MLYLHFYFRFLLIYYVEIGKDYYFDFGTPWIDKSTLRGDCSRFEDTKNKYAADYTLYENETAAQFHDEIIYNQLPIFIPDSKVLKTGYLCNHGVNCPETADLFGEIGYFYAPTNIKLSDNDDTKTGKAFKFITDLLTPSPPSGNLNAIELSSAPRKYYVCCTNGDKPGCNDISTNKAKMAIKKLQLEVLKNEDKKIKLTHGLTHGQGLDLDLAIKKKPWNNSTFSKSNYLNKLKGDLEEDMVIKDETPCGKEKLSKEDLEKCFGNFKPATNVNLPFIIKDYLHDLFGNLIIYLIILYIIFIVLYVLCLLFSLVGKQAWILNKESVWLKVYGKYGYEHG